MHFNALKFNYFIQFSALTKKSKVAYQNAMKQRIIVFIFIIFFTSIEVFSQSANAPLNKDYYHLLDRYEIKQGKLNGTFHSTMKPYQRKSIAQFVDSIIVSEDYQYFGKTDKDNLLYLLNDNWEWSSNAQNDSKKPFLKKLYRKKSDFYHVNTESFDLHVNPVLYLSGGFDRDGDVTPYINTRGGELRGMVDKKIGFYTFLGENQTNFPQYARTWINDTVYNRFSIPNEGFWKSINGSGYDFFTARGYVSFNATKHVNLQLGFDNNFIGNGHRSMIISNFGNAYSYLKIDVKVWKLRYLSMTAEMKGNARASAGGSRSDTRFPNKFLAYHHLSLNVGKNLNLGFFEIVNFGSDDPTRRTVPMNLGYLNPIIFFRAIEQNEGSPDNAILGMDFKWNFLNRFSLYGQLVLDEFKLDNVTAGNGWWANKFGYQFGLKYIDALGISNLDLQLETNIARPYTYAHFTERTNHSHYNLPLAHPYGANFKEYIGIARFQPIHKLTFTGKLIYTDYGADINSTSNFGSDVRKSSSIRVDENGNNLGDFGNELGQGQSNQLFYADFTASYQLKHNFFIDLKAIARSLESTNDDLDNNSLVGTISVRWNIAQRTWEY